MTNQILGAILSLALLSNCLTGCGIDASEKTIPPSPSEGMSDQQISSDNLPKDPPASSSEDLPKDPPKETPSVEPALQPATIEVSGLEMNPDALATLDNTTKNWGQGNNLDEFNRPKGATDYQERFGQYAADFIGQNSQTVYLTLDEGYENGFTAAILDVLKEKQCPAVFFVTMPYVKENPQLVQRMIDEGHVLGNHSVNHPSKGLPSLSLEKQAQELIGLHEYMIDNFDYEMYLFRYPAGIFSEQSLALVEQLGYRSVFWSFAYRDWVTDDQPDPKEALAKINSKMHPGAIYLLHAVSATNTEIMGDFIDDTRNAGYEFGRYEQHKDSDSADV